MFFCTCHHFLHITTKARQHFSISINIDCFIIRLALSVSSNRSSCDNFGLSIRRWSLIDKFDVTNYNYIYIYICIRAYTCTHTYMDTYVIELKLLFHSYYTMILDIVIDSFSHVFQWLKLKKRLYIHQDDSIWSIQCDSSAIIDSCWKTSIFNYAIVLLDIHWLAMHTDHTWNMSLKFRLLRKVDCLESHS
jgi:hypothetical protein